MSKSYTQQIIEYYITDDFNLETDITRLLNVLRNHNLLNDGIDISDEKDILIRGLQNLPVYEKNSKQKIAYQTYRLLLGAIKDSSYKYESDQTVEDHVVQVQPQVQPQVQAQVQPQVQAQPQPVSDFEESEDELEIQRPRSESVSAPNISTIKYQKVNVITIQTSLAEIQERTRRNHD